MHFCAFKTIKKRQDISVCAYVKDKFNYKI